MEIWNKIKMPVQVSFFSNQKFSLYPSLKLRKHRGFLETFQLAEGNQGRNLFCSSSFNSIVFFRNSQSLNV